MSNSRATHPTPTANDVQLGRGGHNWASAGNEQLRQFALGRVQDYAAATKKQKALISREVLQQVKETGGRFLEKIDYENNIWAEVSDKAAKEKVCQVLRDAVSAIRDTNTQRSDRHSSSSSSSSEGSTEDEEIAAESESEGGTEDEESEVQTGTEDSGNHVWDVSAGLPPVEAEIDGLFFQGDIPMPVFTPSASASEAAVVSATAREYMSSFEVASNLCATNCDDFDLFEGELLKSFAVDEIFDVSVSRQNSTVHL